MPGALSLLLLIGLLGGADDSRVPLPDAALLMEVVSCPDDDAFEPDDTPLSARPIASGEVQRHRHCDPDWLRLEAAAGSTWVIETRDLQGGADTVLELYERTDDSVPFERTARDDDSGEAGGSRLVVRLAGRDPYVAVYEARARYGPGKTYEVTARCLSRCQVEGGGRALVVPALFQGDGDGRPFLTSDLLLSNPGFVPVRAELRLSTGAGRERLHRSVTVSGGGTVELRSVLSTAFGLDSGEASLEISPGGGGPGELLASTVLRDASGRPLGVFRAEPIESSLAPGRLGHLLHLDGRPGARASIGLVETTGARAVVTLRFFSADGIPRAERTLDLPPFGVTRLELAEILEPRAGTRATVQTAGGGRVLGFGLVSEDTTSGLFLSTLRTNGGDALHMRGPAAGSTEVRALNAGTQAATATLSFHSEGVSYPVPSTVPSIEPGATLVLDDALAGLQGISTGDGLLRASSPDIVVSARFRSASSGSQIEPLRPFDQQDPAALGTGRGRVSLPLPAGTRSVVLLGEHAEPRALSLPVSLVGADGRTRATAELSVPAGLCGLQGSCAYASSDLLADLGIPEDGSRLDIEVPADSLRLSARVAVEGSSDLFARPVPLGEGLESFTFELPGEVPLVLKRVPAGTFGMGSPEDEPGRDGDEPLRRVTITQPFLIGGWELSEAQWNALGSGGGERWLRPVTGVSWDDVAAPGGFLDRLNDFAHSDGGTEGLLFRLPTEAEWERAARGTTTTPFPYELPCDLFACEPCPVAWAPWACGGSNPYYVPSGPRTDSPFSPYYPGGPYGLREMLGNVWEWVADRYGPYDPSGVVDPEGPAEGELRVIRGGSYKTTLKLCRAANRYGYPPSGAYPDVGFRVVLARPGQAFGRVKTGRDLQAVLSTTQLSKESLEATERQSTTGPEPRPRDQAVIHLEGTFRGGRRP